MLLEGAGSTDTPTANFDVKTIVFLKYMTGFICAYREKERRSGLGGTTFPIFLLSVILDP